MGVYDVAARTVVLAEVLHAIISHRSGSQPLSLEAGIVRVANALDMAQGRPRLAFEAGRINTHSLSATAIDHIEISEGEVKPVQITVTMLNSTGIYQLDELLRDKLQGSGLEPYVEVVATIEGEMERNLLVTGQAAKVWIVGSGVEALQWQEVSSAAGSGRVATGCESDGTWQAVCTAHSAQPTKPNTSAAKELGSDAGRACLLVWQLLKSNAFLSW